MCGNIFGDVGSFISDSFKEIVDHPWQAAGAALGVPGYDPFFGGLFNNGPNGAIISPTGNFTPGAWQDMYNSAGSDTSGLNLFHSINGVADQVAPAAASFFVGPELEAALGGTGMAGADTIGADTFDAGLGAAADAGTTASTLGGLESGMGGAALFGDAAGTGTAIGSGLAQGLGAGGLGMADGSALSGLTASGGTYLGGLGGGTAGTGLSGAPTGGAQLPGTFVGQAGDTSAAAVPTSSGAASMEGSQAMANGASSATPGATTGSGAPYGYNPAAMAPADTGADTGSLSAMFGPDSSSTGSITGQGVANAAGNNGQSLGVLGQGSGGNVNMATDIPGQSIGSDYNTAANSAEQGGGWENVLGNLFGGGNQGTMGNLGSLMKLFNTGMNAYQQYSQQQKNNTYANQIQNIFSPTGAYAQQMQSNIARQYAAQGRNAETGPQNVQLAAALAQAQAQALGNSNYAKAATSNNGTGMLNSLFANFGSPQGLQQLGNLYNMGSSGLSALGNLF